MEREELRPDARFWTPYDHFMIEREARARRRKHIRLLMRAYWKRAKARIVRSLKHAGAQPVKPHPRTA
jgi:hypothetical protein